MKPHISIIILNYNGEHFLNDCLDSLFSQSFRSFEIVLVDNASNYNPFPDLKKRYKRQITAKKLVLIRKRENTGFAEGSNIGVRRARGKFIILMNNDTKADPGFIAELVRALKAEEKRGRPVTVGGVPYPEKRSKDGADTIHQRGIANTITLSQQFAFREMTTKERESGRPESLFAGGAGLIYRKSDFPVPFIKRYFAYGEDLYLGWLCRLRGGRNVIDPKARYLHYGGVAKRSSSRINEISIFNGTKNEMVNFLIFFEIKNIARIAPLFALTQLGHIVQQPQKLIVKLKAYIWIIMSFRWIMQLRRKVQRQRKVPDTAIISHMSDKFYEEESILVKGAKQKRILKALNKFCKGYCRLVGLRTIDR